MRAQAVQRARLAGLPARMKAVDRAGMQPVAATSCEPPGIETSRALGMVAGAAATLAGGSAGSAVPLTNTTGTLLRTIPDTPGSCGQIAHNCCCQAAVAASAGVNSDSRACWAMAAGFIAAQASLQRRVISCSWVGAEDSAETNPRLLITVAHWPWAKACRSWAAAPPCPVRRGTRR